MVIVTSPYQQVASTQTSVQPGSTLFSNRLNPFPQLHWGLQLAFRLENGGFSFLPPSLPSAVSITDDLHATLDLGTSEQKRNLDLEARCCLVIQT